MLTQTPPTHIPPLDHRHALAHLGALNGRSLAGWAGTDHYQVITLHVKSNLAQTAPSAAYEALGVQSPNCVKTCY